MSVSLTDQATPERIGAKPIMSVAEAATYLGISRRFLESQIARGRIPVSRLSRRCIRIRREALDRYVDSCTATA